MTSINVELVTWHFILVHSKGVLANFMEILKPLSIRDEAILRQKKSLGQDADSVRTNTIYRSSVKSNTTN